MTNDILYGSQKSRASTNNATNDPLSNGSMYVGKWELHSATSLMLTCLADQDCVVTIQFSHDRGNNVHSALSYNVTANSHEIHTLQKGTRSGFLKYRRGKTLIGAMRVGWCCHQEPIINSPVQMFLTTAVC